MKFSLPKETKDASMTFIFGETELKIKVVIKDSKEEIYLNLEDCG